MNLHPAFLRTVPAAPTIATSALAAAQPVNISLAAIPAPKSASPQEGPDGSIAIALHPGDQAFVGVRTRASGWLYCYAVDNQDRVSQLLAVPDRPLVHVAAGEVLVFAASQTAGQRAVSCFSSARLLGRHPLPVDGIHGGVEALRTRFASATGNNFEMGVFHVKRR